MTLLGALQECREEKSVRGSRYWKRLQREGWKELEEEAEGWSWCGTEKNKAGGESVWS